MIAGLVLALAMTGAPEPTYVVERVVRMGDDVRRTSVFRNGVAVVVEEKSGKRTRFARQALTDVELRVVIQVADETYPELQRFAGGVEGPGLGTVELRVAPPGREPLSVRYPVGSVVVLGAARIGQALDGLEAEMSRFRGEREDLREWVPHVGDRVELEDGRVVGVLEALAGEKGTVLRLQIGDGPASIFMTDEELHRVAIRRVMK
jgi:hypothetical protein